MVDQLPPPLRDIAYAAGVATATADRDGWAEKIETGVEPPLKRTPCPYDLRSPSITRRRMGAAWMDGYLSILPIPDYAEVEP